jgi:hypothetical protein
VTGNGTHSEFKRQRLLKRLSVADHYAPLSSCGNVDVVIAGRIVADYTQFRCLVQEFVDSVGE